jgi:hypothetical protein
MRDASGARGPGCCVRPGRARCRRHKTLAYCVAGVGGPRSWRITLAREIIIDFDPGPGAPSLTHQVRNFGEALYHACEADGWASIAMEDVDRATNQLRVTVRTKRRVRRVMSMIDKLLEAHLLRSRARVSAVSAPE